MMMNLSKVRPVLALALLLSAAGCELFTESDRPRVALTLPASAFVRGGSLPLSMENRSGRSWYAIALCNNGIERLQEGVWTPVYGNSCSAFVMAEETSDTTRLTYAPTEVAPGATVVLNWTLPLDAAPGAHRIRVRVTSGPCGDGDAYELLSPQFTVLDAAALRR
jgi:hypothetical protein